MRELNYLKAKQENDPFCLSLFEEDQNHTRYQQTKIKEVDFSAVKQRNEGTAFKMKRYDRIAFMNYPIDGGEFVTKPLKELVEMQVGENADQPLVFTDENLKAPEKIMLHCTLPQWNKRLIKRLDALNKQINQYNVIISPHMQKKQLVTIMSNLIEIHCKHEYINFENLVKFPRQNKTAQEQAQDIIDLKLKSSGFIQQRKNRDNAVKSLAAINEGINSIIGDPQEDNPITKPYYIEQKHITDAADELWQLFNSPAFKVELKNYLSYIKENNDPGIGGGIPPGPYMDGIEDSWHEIFVTIAECYAALSSVDKYYKILWDNEVLEAIDYLTQLDPDDPLDQAMVDQFSRNAAKEIEVMEDAGEQKDPDLPNYVADQKLDMTAILADGRSPGGGTLVTLLNDGVKPLIGHLLPGIGAPCSLQVILALFEDDVLKTILDKAKGDPTIPLRFSHNVTKIALHQQTLDQMEADINKHKQAFNRAHPTKGNKSKAKAQRKIDRMTARRDKTVRALTQNDDTIVIRKLTEATPASKNARAAKLRVERAKWMLKTRISLIEFSGEDDDSSQRKHGKHHKFYKQFDNKAGGLAKVVYMAWNLTLQWGALQSSVEKALDDPYKEKTVKDIVNDFTNLAATGTAVGTLAMSVGNIVTRFKDGTTMANLGPSARRTVSGVANNVLDRASIVLGIVTSLISAYEAIEHFKNGDLKSAARSALDFSANAMITAGFLRQYASKKTKSLAVKTAARVGVRAGVAASSTLALTGGAAATGIGLTVAPFILLAGTIISVGLLIWDLAALATHILSSSSQQFLVAHWNEFKADLTVEQKKALDNLNLRDDMVLYDHWADVESFYLLEPYKLYSDKFENAKWPANENSMAGSIAVLDDIHENEWWDSDSVDLGYLSWRAVIPMYEALNRKLFDKDLIKQMVKIKLLKSAPGLVTDAYQPMKTSDEIIDYYEAAIAEKVKLTKELESSRLTDGEREAKEQAIKDQFYLHPDDSEDIIELLKQGRFTAPNTVILGHLNRDQEIEVNLKGLDASRNEAKLKPVARKAQPGNALVSTETKQEKEARELHNLLLQDYQEAKEAGDLDDLLSTVHMDEESKAYLEFAKADNAVQEYNKEYSGHCKLFKWQSWADLSYTLPEHDETKSIQQD